MAESITVTGMILSAQPNKEYDRRLVLLTKERGKISVFANGVRRPTAMLSGCSQPFVFGKFTLYEGRDSYTLQAVEPENFFAELRTDLEAVYYGVYFCEFAETVTREGLPAKEELKVLYRSLGALLKKSIGVELVRAIFELKMLSVGGISPQVYECVKCRKKEDLHWFSAKSGGCVCKSCADKLWEEEVHAGGQNEGLTVGERYLPMSGSTLYTMQYILATPIESLYTFTVTEDVLSQLKKILKEFTDLHIGRKFKSLEMLELL
ncbi:MAG: DNA repair protein RecO [Lachnospiraceae bacterium]|nr:DNA repair protein RecO [Lachnospiraceae bacterium]MBQ8846379.1 DNA repair protein RecO [Lachnospiraceae bacterium]